MVKALGPLILATISACAPTPVAGTVGGGAFTAKDAIYLPATSGQDLAILIADYAGVCNVPNNKASSHVLGVSFNTSVTPAVPGSFPLPSSGVSAMLSTFDAQCARQTDFATGTVTITSASPDAISGSIDVMFSGGSLRGSFTAPACSLDSSAATDGGACLP